MLPTIAYAASSLVYLLFLGAVGLATGLLFCLFLRRRPKSQTLIADALIAALSGLLCAVILALVDSVRGGSFSQPRTLIPVAVASVAIRELIVARRKAG